MRLRDISAVVAILATPLSAQHLSEFCPSSDICYNLNIPEETAKSGSGDIYFQISGPTSYSWIGLGQGSAMVGANIFVMYTDGRGNVTVSPRYATAEEMPDHDTVANITLLEGSGVAGNKMVANVRCGNCQSWQGGTMDFSESSGGWLFASRPGDPIDSTDLDATIEEHQDKGTFTWDFTKAKGGSDINPFVTNGKQVSSVPKPASSGNDDGGDSDGDDDDPVEIASVPDSYVTAHGAVAAVAFLVLFPSGAIFIRVPALSKYGGVKVHAAIQIFAYITFIAAAGLGIYIAKVQEQLLDYHPIIGMILLGVLFTQPFTGLLHHHFFTQKHRRTIISYNHLFVGRVAIILGMINGGFGLLLADETNMGYLAAYGVVAGVIGSLYLLVIIYGEVQRARIPSVTPSRDEGPKESSGGLEAARQAI